jgi:hypothetical protein
MTTLDWWFLNGLNFEKFAATCCARGIIETNQAIIIEGI